MNDKMRIKRQDVESIMYRFFDNYYTKRDVEALAEIVSSNIIAVGLAEEELGISKDSFINFAYKQMQDFPYPLPYKLRKMDISENMDGSAVCFAIIDIKVINDDWGKIDYKLRLTATINFENARPVISMLHASEALSTTNVNIPSIDKIEIENDKEVNRYTLGKLMNRLMPGGVLTCKLSEGYPITYANTKFLNSIGYEDFADLIKQSHGNFIECIHVDDLAKYERNIAFALASMKQCECEYRIRLKNGEYLWIHDIARIYIDKNGDKTLLSLMIDISEQIETNKRLEKETEIDELTGIFNRKGARKQINGLVKDDTPWIFLEADIDNFKRVNDIYGHKQGDQILCYVANQLHVNFSDYGIVFRLGGDEFALFLSNFNSLSRIEELMNEVSNNYSELLDDVCPLADSSLSIGGVYGKGLKDFEIIYEEADRNLYKIKSKSKGQIKLTSLE